MAWQRNYSLTDANYLRLQARTLWHSAPATEVEIAADLRRANREGLPSRILGQGSNVLLSEDFPGLTLVPQAAGISVLRDGNAVLVQAGAGEDWPALVSWCCRQGLHGLENLAMIPGSVGAAPVQNIGAYGVELSERLEDVSLLVPGSAASEKIPARDCQFGYRSSAFKSGALEGVICAITLRLGKGLPPSLGHQELANRVAALAAERRQAAPSAELVYEAVCALRREKLPDPGREPNVGSFFLNPQVSATVYQRLLQGHPGLPGFSVSAGKVKLSAAALIEARGWKGRRFGHFGISSRHALTLTHHGQGNRAGILALASAIREDIWQRFGVELQIEPSLL